MHTVILQSHPLENAFKPITVMKQKRTLNLITVTQYRGSYADERYCCSLEHSFSLKIAFNFNKGLPFQVNIDNR